MVIKVFGFIAAEGEPMELAFYTHTLLEVFKLKAEFDEQQKDKEFLNKFGDFSLSDLMKMEMEKEDKRQEDKPNDGTGV